MNYVFYLKWPPSVNNYYAHTKRGVFIKAAGKRYREAAQADIIEQGMRVGLDDRIMVKIVMYPPDARIRDLDNYTKCLLDACTHAGVWEDDKQIDQLLLLRGQSVKYGSVMVSISDAGPLIPNENQIANAAINAML